MRSDAEAFPHNGLTLVAGLEDGLPLLSGAGGLAVENVMIRRPLSACERNDPWTASYV